MQQHEVIQNDIQGMLGILYMMNDDQHDLEHEMEYLQMELNGEQD
jgi:hypothetical protein